MSTFRALLRSAVLMAFALLAWGRSEATPFTVGDTRFSDLLTVAFDSNQPYMSLYPDNVADTVHYDAALDLLSIPGAANSLMRFRPGGVSSGSNNDFYFDGRYSLFMNLAGDEQSLGGIFSIFGTIPEFGIQQSALLLAATVIGAELSASSQEFVMKLNYANPSFGNWGPYLLLADNTSVGYYDGSFNQRIPYTNNTNLLSQSWYSVASDYYDLYSLPTLSIPEPATLPLVGAAFLAIAAIRRRKAPSI